MKLLLTPILSLAVIGCIAPANPPSLLPRAIETRPEATLTPPSSVVSTPISAAMAAQIAALVATAKAGDAEFAEADQSGSEVVRAGRAASPGSEAWVAAELVRSALQVARQRSATALAEIDSLAVTQGELTTRDANAGGVADILAAQAEVEAIVARQTARLEALSR